MFGGLFAKYQSGHNPIPVKPIGLKPSAEIRHITKNAAELVKPVEHSDNYKIVIVLDESGSMGHIKNDIITSINELIKEQKNIPDRKCNFTLVKFADSTKKLINNINLDNVSELTSKDYEPNGSTALYDAIGETINLFRYETNVLMVVVTDGEENASKSYTSEIITSMLAEKQKYRGWTYIYMCNDLKTSSQGTKLGLENNSYSSNCVVDQNNYGLFLSKNINQAITNHRVKGISVQSQLNQPQQHKKSYMPTETISSIAHPPSYCSSTRSSVSPYARQTWL
jgi:hypothetical protein